MYAFTSLSQMNVQYKRQEATIVIYNCLSWMTKSSFFCGSIQVTAIASAIALVVHFLVCWLFVDGLKLGVVGTMATVSISWWVNVLITLGYSVCGGCPLTWTGFSSEAFTGLWEFLKLSASSGVMLWYELFTFIKYPFLILLSVCTSTTQFFFKAVGDLSLLDSLENWYYQILVIMTGTLQNPRIAVDSLSIW